MNDNDEGVGLTWALAQIKKNLGSVQSTGKAQDQPREETGEDWGEREKLDIARCQYGVPDNSAYQDGYVSDCGEPAIAKWTWKSGSLFVCEKHDEIIELAEIEAQALPVSSLTQTPTDTVRKQETSETETLNRDEKMRQFNENRPQ